MNPVDEFILNKEGVQKDILQYFHFLIMAQPGMTCKIAYRVPFYYGKSWVCYLSPLKTGGVDLSFIRGNELSNAQGLLEARDRKIVRSLSYHSLEEIPEKAVLEILHEALLLDEKVKFRLKRKKERGE